MGVEPRGGVASDVGGDFPPTMRTLRICLLGALALVAAFAVADTGVKRNAKTDPAAEAEWRRSNNGFGATVVVTTDPEWKRKWGTPTSRVPRVTPAKALRVGEKVWALLFLTNPLQDESGNVDVTCDLRMIRPNGRISEHREVKALRKKTIPVPGQTYMSEFVLTMVGEETDPVGEWVVEFVVRDRKRGVEVPVVSRYTLLPKAAPQLGASSGR